MGLPCPRRHPLTLGSQGWMCGSSPFPRSTMPQHGPVSDTCHHCIPMMLCTAPSYHSLCSSLHLPLPETCPPTMLCSSLWQATLFSLLISSLSICSAAVPCSAPSCNPPAQCQQPSDWTRYTSGNWKYSQVWSSLRWVHHHRGCNQQSIRCIVQAKSSISEACTETWYFTLSVPLPSKLAREGEIQETPT